MALRQLSEHLHVFEDSCNVYLVRDGEHGLLVDAGSGAVADVVADADVRSLEWVLHTHFHRDQCWGTPGLVERRGVRVAVPEYERHLFERAREHWNTKRIFDNYNWRGAFALGDDVVVDRSLADYEPFVWRGIAFHVLPAKGHTLGSSALLAEIDGRVVAFTGDLITAGGHVHQLHALEFGWGCYSVVGGALYTLQSLQALSRQSPQLLLPSHGPPIERVAEEVELLQRRLRDVIRLGTIASDDGLPSSALVDLELLPETPFAEVSEHLLWSGPTACANFYVLLSGTGEALLIDYGHVHWSYMHTVGDQSSFETQRFVAHRLEQLRERHGVHTIEVVCATHTHDDHVCGIPYLQRHHGTACWALDAVADVLEQPAAWAGLPCTIPTPIEVERKLADGERVAWRGFELTFHDAPGHAEFHSTISAEIDGVLVAFTGDNYFVNDVLVDGEPVLELGQDTMAVNGGRLEMYRRSVEVLRRVSPDLICPGHGEVRPLEPAQLEQVAGYVERAERAFRELVGSPADHFTDVAWARLSPYFAPVPPGAGIAYTLALRNNLERRATFEARLLPPAGWSAPGDVEQLVLDADEAGELVFALTVPGGAEPRGRRLVTAEICIDGRSQGPVAEAVIAVEPRSAPGEAVSATAAGASRG